MAGFDVNAAKAAGYSDAEINTYLKHQGDTHVGPAQGQGWDPNNPTNDMSASQLWAAGAGRGTVHLARNIGNMVGLVPNSALDDEKQIDAPLLATQAGKVGNVFGEAAPVAALTGGISSGLGALEGVPYVGGVSALATNPLANATMQGALQGAVTSDPGERLKNAAIGGATGAGLSLTGSALSKLVRGLSRTPDAQRLLDNGVQLTPGQLNPGGVMNQFEGTVESVPGVKQIVHGARDAAEQDFQQAVIAKAAAPGTTITPSENIHEMLQQAQDSYTPLYDQAKGFPVKAAVMNGRQGVKLTALFNQAAQAPGTTDQAQRAAKSWLDNELTRLPPNPDSADLIALRSNIRSAARNAKMGTDTIAQDKAIIFGLADKQVTKALESQLPKNALTALQSADSQYGTYKVVEDAVARAKDNIAGLTPQKLSQAIYAATDNPAYAKGAGGELRELAKAGTSVFQTVSPPTGARLLTLGAGAAGSYMAPIPTGAAGGLMLGLTGTNVGRRLASGQTGGQVFAQRLSDALSANTPNVLKSIGQRAAVGAAMPYTPGAMMDAATLAAALKRSPDTPRQ